MSRQYEKKTNNKITGNQFACLNLNPDSDSDSDLDDEYESKEQLPINCKNDLVHLKDMKIYPHLRW